MYTSLQFQDTHTQHIYATEMDWAMGGQAQTQIPAFGNWNVHHDPPAVRQCFADPAMRDGRRLFRNHFYLGEDDRHLEMFNLPRPPPPSLPYRQQKPRRSVNERKKKEKEKRHLKDGVVKDQKRARRVCDETQQRQMHRQLQQQLHRQEQVVTERRNGTTVKAVDEDLYKIPPELLYQKKPKTKMLRGFLKGCLGLNFTDA